MTPLPSSPDVPPTTIDLRDPSAVCVIGSGPAGLVTAAELVRQGVSVTLLESGRVDHDHELQALSDGEYAGDPLNASNIVENRTRRLAGNANAWVVKTAGEKHAAQMGLRYGFLNGDDFAERPWIEGSGWPFDVAELEPWFESAHRHYAIGAYNYAPPNDLRPDALGDDFWRDFDAKWFRFGVSDRYRSELVELLQSSPLARIEVSATATKLVRSEVGGPIERVDYCTADGEAGTVEAKRFVLACGAIENARLLLASDRAAGGIGNEHDHVGRYFMDHPLFSIGHIEIDRQPTKGDDAIGAMGFFDLAPHNGEMVHGYAATSRALTEELGATQIGLSIFPRPNERQLAAAEALKWFVHDPAGHLRDRRTLTATVKTVCKGLDYFPRAAYNSLIRHRSLLPGFGRGGWADGHDGMAFTRLEVVFQCEQPPLAESRVTLGYENDRFGTPLPHVDWRAGSQVRESVLAVQRRLADHVEASGIGHYVPRAGSFDELGVPSSMAHHLGTTRMSEGPEDGVVDPNGRVHSVPNLYIAGSSVFPTSGYMNPTLTIVALAERLAHHLATTPAPVTPAGPTDRSGAPQVQN